MDADYAGLLVYKRSTIGYIFGKYLLRDICVYLGSNPVTWQNKKQFVVTRSNVT